MRIPFTLIALAALTASAAGCGSAAVPSASIRFGENHILGQGSVRSWIALDREGRPSALGITLAESALAGLAPDSPALLTLGFPPAAGALPFDHVELDWRPAGHPPAGVYDKPHLDVRFYLLSRAAREAITDSARAARIPLLDLIPQSYVPVPGLLPQAGARWMDPTAPELHGEPLRSGLLYGFYDGELTFLESLVTRALLEGSPEITRELKLPRSYARPGYYPTRYTVRYDQRRREYTVALEGLLPHHFPPTPR